MSDPNSVMNELADIFDAIADVDTPTLRHWATAALVSPTPEERLRRSVALLVVKLIDART